MKAGVKGNYDRGDASEMIYKNCQYFLLGHSVNRNITNSSHSLGIY
jgi:hypothetical protein